MIIFEFTDGLMCPILQCDYCGKRVRSNNGMVGCMDHDKPEPICLHKGDCDRRWKETRGEMIYWQDIEEFIVHFTFNVMEDAVNPLRHLPPANRAELNEWRTLRPRLAPIVFRRDGHKCTYCGSTQRLTVDHIKPLSKGGSHDLSNLTTACRSCNSQKGAKTPQE